MGSTGEGAEWPAQGLTVAEHTGSLFHHTGPHSFHCLGPPYRNEGSAHDPLFPSPNWACSSEPRAALRLACSCSEAEGSSRCLPCWGRPLAPWSAGCAHRRAPGI